MMKKLYVLIASVAFIASAPAHAQATVDGSIEASIGGFNLEKGDNTEDFLIRTRVFLDSIKRGFNVGAQCDLQLGYKVAPRTFAAISFGYRFNFKTDSTDRGSYVDIGGLFGIQAVREPYLDSTQNRIIEEPLMRWGISATGQILIRIKRFYHPFMFETAFDMSMPQSEALMTYRYFFRAAIGITPRWKKGDVLVGVDCSNIFGNGGALRLHLGPKRNFQCSLGFGYNYYSQSGTVMAGMRYKF